MANGIFGTNTDILYINAGGAGDYSGTSGVFVDNVNRIISLTGDYASAIPQISANSANIAELSSKFEDCCSSVQGDITNLSSSITSISGDVINKLDVSSFSAVSGNFLTAMPQGVMYENRLNFTDDLRALSGYNGVPFVGSNSPSDGYELIEGDYIQLLDNSANKTTQINVTGLPNFSDLATKDEVSSYLLKSESGNFYPMTGNPSGFLTAHQDLGWYVKAGTPQTGSATSIRGDYFFGNMGGYSPMIRISGRAWSVTGDFQISDKGISGHQLAGSSWTALRNVDMGLRTDGTVSSISGHEIGAGYTPTYRYIEV